MVQMTQHAQARMQQRGITKLTLESLLDFGVTAHDHRGAEIVYFNKKARSQLLKASGRRHYQAIEKQLNAYAVVAEDGAVVTVGRRHRRISRI
jgi:hypothetical protein